MRGEGIGEGGFRKGTDRRDRGGSHLTSYALPFSELASELPQADCGHPVVLTKLMPEIKLL